MKKIILILLTVVAVTANAQRVETINSEILHPEKRFELLDRTEITTGNLINRALVFSDHTQFYKDSVDTNSFVGWQQLYHEIYKGYYNKASITSIDSIKSNIAQQKANDIVPILIVDLEYNQLKDSALVDSLIIDDNGVFKDNLQRTESPYQKHRIVSFAPASNIIYKTDYTFLVSKAFFFTNQASYPTTVEIDFGDGQGFKAVNWETTYNVTYNNVASKTLTIKIDYGNGEITTQSNLKTSTKCADCLTWTLANIPDEFSSIAGTVPASVSHVSGSATINYYIKSNGTVGNTDFLDKPFILVEGLDFEDTECVVPHKNGGIGWCSLWGQGGEDAFEKAPDLLNDLLVQGYDIIMIDYKDGSTYIERNAFALIEFLNYINNNRNAGPSVIVGTSMGGLVSHYSLSV